MAKRLIFSIFFLIASCCALFPSFLLAQKQGDAQVMGQIITNDHNPLFNVKVELRNRIIAVSDSNGNFQCNIPASQFVKLSFVKSGFGVERKSVYVNKGQQRHITIEMKLSAQELETVKVSGKRNQSSPEMIKVDVGMAKFNPSITTGVEGLIKTYVGSNNELTSQYNVRGGNYDENLVYVNGFEIYRPFLVQNGQSEGLSFINADMTSKVAFSPGGFQVKYGDKMSSVLDVQYKRPDTAGGSAYLGLLEQGLHLEGISTNKKFTYIIGARNRTNQNVVKSQSTRGNYNPQSSDIQGLLTYQMNEKWRLELLGNYNATRFNFYPQSDQLTTGVFTPLYVSQYNLNIDFMGREKDRYTTNFLGFTAVQDVNTKLRMKWMFSHFGDREQQYTDIQGDYTFSDDASTDLLASGTNIDFSRNKLNIDLWTAQNRGYLNLGKNYLLWGLSFERQNVKNYINQWTYVDSAGYSTPNSGNAFNLNDYMFSNDHFYINRTTGFLQDNLSFGEMSGWTMQAGVRYNYNTLNKQFLLSPRLSFAFQPMQWQRDVVFHGSLGVYNQPPFFREMLRYDGSINKALKAQKSWQAVAGMDYKFKMGTRPSKFTVEAYYKSMWDVDPYDQDNVRIRYYGNNNAKAYAAGIETRWFGQLVEGAESWISLGYMKTMENIDGLNYTSYFNQAGDKITPTTADQKVVDSTVTPVGWVRRPTDRRITLGMFLQDYMGNNKNCKVFLNTIYGSNLPYNLPNVPQYRNGMQIDPYFRMDLGFNMLLLDGSKVRRSYSPFRKLKQIWAGLEIFNILDRDNVISYNLIKDYNNTVYALPNRLTPRLLNVKLSVSW